MNFYEYYDDDWDDDDYWNDDQSGDGDFNYQMCENGCIYNIEKMYILLYSTRESTGLMKNRIDTLNNSLYELIDTCNDNNICGSIDLDINGGHLYNSHRYLSHQNFTFLIKNNHFTTSTTNTQTQQIPKHQTTQQQIPKHQTTQTSTTNTQTSTTNTQTSTTNTQTSTTNTQTSTTNTQTSTTNTQTSTTNTQTSTTNTLTSTTNTKTSTTITNTSLLVNPDSSRTDNDNSSTNRNLIPLYAIMGIIGAGGLAFGVTKAISIKRENNLNERLNRTADGYSNPAYGIEQGNVDLDNNEAMNSYYQDVEVANLSDRSINDEYMEVSEA